MGWDAAAAACELMADVNHAGGEVDVPPAQSEHLGETHTGVGAGEKERPVPARTGSKETGEFSPRQDPLAGGNRMWSLVTLQGGEGVPGDVPMPQCIAEDAAELAEDPLHRPGR